MGVFRAKKSLVHCKLPKRGRSVLAFSAVISMLKNSN